MAWYVFWAQVAQMQFLGSNPQGQDIFSDFMILLDSAHDSWEKEAMFVKIAARILELWFNTFSGPKWRKCSFWILNPKAKTFFEISWF